MEEVQAPQCNPNFMQGFGRLTNFTDEEIQEMWLKYDADQSGELEHDKIRQLLVGFLQAGGAMQADLSDMRGPVERLIFRMDTSGEYVNESSTRSQRVKELSDLRNRRKDSVGPYWRDNRFPNAPIVLWYRTFLQQRQCVDDPNYSPLTCVAIFITALAFANNQNRMFLSSVSPTQQARVDSSFRMRTFLF